MIDWADIEMLFVVLLSALAVAFAAGVCGGFAIVGFELARRLA